MSKREGKREKTQQESIGDAKQHRRMIKNIKALADDPGKRHDLRATIAPYDIDTPLKLVPLTKSTRAVAKKAGIKKLRDVADVQDHEWLWAGMPLMAVIELKATMSVLSPPEEKQDSPAKVLAAIAALLATKDQALGIPCDQGFSSLLKICPFLNGRDAAVRAAYEASYAMADENASAS